MLRAEESASVAAMAAYICNAPLRGMAQRVLQRCGSRAGTPSSVRGHNLASPPAVTRPCDGGVLGSIVGCFGSCAGHDN